jgi:hypothetical protein
VPVIIGPTLASSTSRSGTGSAVHIESRQSSHPARAAKNANSSGPPSRCRAGAEQLDTALVQPRPPAQQIPGIRAPGPRRTQARRLRRPRTDRVTVSTRWPRLWPRSVVSAAASSSTQPQVQQQAGGCGGAQADAATLGAFVATSAGRCRPSQRSAPGTNDRPGQRRRPPACSASHHPRPNGVRAGAATGGARRNRSSAAGRNSTVPGG